MDAYTSFYRRRNRLADLPSLRYPHSQIDDGQDNIPTLDVWDEHQATENDETSK